jgi:hypothetical protein
VPVRVGPEEQQRPVRPRVTSTTVALAACQPLARAADSGTVSPDAILGGTLRGGVDVGRMFPTAQGENEARAGAGAS